MVQREHFTNMEMSFQIFESITGLKVNMDKSCMVRISIEENRLGELVGVIGCKIGSWPLKYLGMPLGEILRRFPLGIR